jgi:hypothetical protein
MMIPFGVTICWGHIEQTQPDATQFTSTNISTNDQSTIPLNKPANRPSSYYLHRQHHRARIIYPALLISA